MAKQLPILVVDDEDMIRVAVTRELGRVGYVVKGVASAEEGLEALEKERFACAVTDLRMPGAGGHAFIRGCGEIDPEMPIIVITAFGEKEDVIECLRAGVFDFVEKPWSDGHLRAIVMRALESRAKRRLSTPPRDAPAAAAPEPASAPAVASSQGPSPSSPPQTAARKSAFAEVIERIRKGELALPAVPSVVLEVRQKVENPTCSAQDLRETIEADAHLSAQIMRLANTTYYAGTGRVSDLQSALTRIGIREISTLVDGIFARDFYRVEHPAVRAEVEAVFRHSWTRGVLMRLLAKAVTRLGVPPETAYIAGLFCDAGAPTLYRIVSQVAPAAPAAQMKSFVAEHHALVGGAVAEAWRLPPEAIDAAKRHHEPVSPKGALILQLVWAAEPLCVDLGATGDPKALDGGDFVLDSLLPGPAWRAELLVQAERYMEAHGSFINGPA
ncbi:MAG: HDOD domain-containing protein [Deltaproteobacteria bacterium]|nr:HDOD domain-containing protein [Deltaproteobacteria bacterium]